MFGVSLDRQKGALGDMLDTPRSPFTALPRADAASWPPEGFPPAGPASKVFPAAPRRSRLSLLIRISIGVLLCTVGAGFLYSRLIDLSSSDAVLTGAPVTLRTPVEGIFQPAAIESGQILEKGVVFGQIRNDRVDNGRLLELNAKIQSMQGDITALQHRLGYTDNEAALAHTRADGFRATRVEQIRTRMRQADASIQAALAKLRLSEATHVRAVSLYAARHGSAATADEAQRDRDVAVTDLTTAVQHRTTLQMELAAAQQGTFTSDAGSDLSASQQVADRLRAMRQDLMAQLHEATARMTALKQHAAAEEARLALLSEAQITLPVRSRLLLRYVEHDEYLHRGERIALLSDCGRPLVTTQVDERKFRDLHLGMKAVFLLGATTATQFDSKLLRYDGTVVELLTPYDSRPSDAAKGGEYRAVIRLSTPEAIERCDTGKMGLVRFH